MSVVIPVGCALLLLAFFYFTTRPILSRRPRPVAHAAAHAYLELQHQKELVYAAIKELELDLAVGKIADDDYAEQRRLLEGDAVDLLHKLESGQGGDLDAIESQINRDLSRLDEDGTDAETCGCCGARRLVDHRFCPQCGTEFSA